MTQTGNWKRWPLFIVAGVLFLACSATIKTQELPPNVTVDESVAPGDSHKHEITLHTGEFARLTVEQTTQDVITAIFTPSNEPLMEASGTNLSSFKVAFIAKSEGQYRVEIRPRIMAIDKVIVQYRLRMDAPHQATSTDEETASASLALHEANHWLVSNFNKDLLPSAIESYRRVLELPAIQADHEAEAGAFQHLADSYFFHNDLDDAAGCYARASQLWRIADNWKGESYASLAEISLNRLGGHYSNSITNANDLLARAKERGDTEIRTKALIELTSVYSATGELELVIETQQKLLELEPTQTTLKAAGYFENIANRYLSLHESRVSIDYRMHAVLIYEKLGLTAPRATALARIALDYSTIGDTKLALQYSDAAVKLDPRQIDPIVLANVGQTGRAIQLLREGIALLPEQKSSMKAGSLLKLAGVYMQAMQPELALEAFDEALAAWPANESPGRRIEFLAAIGRGYENLGKPGKALNVFQEYLREVQAKGVEGFPQYPGFLAEMARSERDLGRLDDAREHLTTAINLREKARSQIASPEIAASLFSQSRFIFAVYTDVLMRQGHEAEAFEASEQARAHALLANLSNTISKVREGVDPQLIEEERRLQSGINEATLQKSTANGAAKAQAAQYKIGELTAKLELLRGEIRRSSPSYASLTEPVALKLSEVRTKVLEPGTTLLEFSLGDAATSYVWEVTSDSLRSAQLPARSVIDAAARRVLESLQARVQKPQTETPAQRKTRLERAEKDLTTATATLSRMVLGPLGNIAGKRLLIVTDGTLDFVPFSMLLDPRSPAPLVASYEIDRVPSASALATIRDNTISRHHDPEHQVAILADPVFSAQDERIAATFRSTAPAVPEALKRSLTETGMTLPRLVYTVQEANAIENAAQRGSTVRKVGVEANRNFATSGAIGDYRIVHFATHGLLNTEAPALSGIVLSLVDKQGKPQDGFLRLHDIYNLHLNADLVVLSACQTALGSQVEGEGVMSLSRSFFYAGAASVLASLWTVDDRATAELMGDFYRNMLSNKKSPAAALRAAQQKMQQSPLWSSPYYWAAFELQGEWK